MLQKTGGPDIAAAFTHYETYRSIGLETGLVLGLVSRLALG